MQYAEQEPLLPSSLSHKTERRTMANLTIIFVISIVYVIIAWIFNWRLDRITREILIEQGLDGNEFVPVFWGQALLSLVWPALLIILKGQLTKESLKKHLH